MRATRIDWDFDEHDVLFYADGLANESELTSFFRMGCPNYRALPDKERKELVAKQYCKDKEKAARFLGLPDTILIPDWLEDGDIKKWLSDTFGFDCKGYELCENVKYTATEAANIKARVRLLLDQIGSKWQTIDEFSDDACDAITESIMVNNFEAVLPEDIDENFVMRELLNLLIFKTA